LIQISPSNASNVATWITLIVAGIGSILGAWTTYKLKMAQIAADAAKVTSDTHTAQLATIQEEQAKTTSLVNGSLGIQKQTLLTSAKALAVSDPTPVNAALAKSAQEDLDAHNASIASGAKP
jgi:membrane protein YqaA with SNARE-associated domain